MDNELIITENNWEEVMKNKPCYRPVPPWFDCCLNMDSDKVKRLDCKECIERGVHTYAKGILDQIEKEGV